MVFTAYGLGGFSLSLLAGRLFDIYQSYAPACYVSAGLLALAAVLTLIATPPRTNPPAVREHKP
jgi:predicted MFS family arabinose efflux permease